MTKYNDQLKNKKNNKSWFPLGCLMRLSLKKIG